MLQVNGNDHLYDLDEPRPKHKGDRWGGLITWADLFAAKKWPFPGLTGRSCAGWTYPAENGPHRPHGRPNSPAESTRADGRIGGGRPRTGHARSSRRPAAPDPVAAGQGRGHRAASGCPGYADMVAR